MINTKTTSVTTISARIFRADGTIEDKGIIATVKKKNLFSKIMSSIKKQKLFSKRKAVK